MDAKRLQDISEIRVGCLFGMVLVMCLPFLAIGSLMIGVSIHGALEQAAVNAATRRVPVTILSGEVIQFHGGGTVGNPRSGTTEYAPAIEFTYERDGRTETSDRVYPVGQPDERSKAQDAVDRYPVGSTAEAWLPDDPTEKAFLEKHWNPFVYAGVAAGLWAWAFCGFLLCVSGGWRWVPRSWTGALAIGVLVMGLTGWAAWHMHTFVPAADTPGWMTIVWACMAAAAFLPVLGAWLATRVALALRNSGFE